MAYQSSYTGTQVDAALAKANTSVQHTASTAVGSGTKGVYVASDGTATAMTYSVNKDVPSNAVFTDTNTKVTQNVSTTNSNLPVLLSASASNTTDTAGKTTSIYGNASTGEFGATSVKIGTKASLSYDTTENCISITFS